MCVRAKSHYRSTCSVKFRICETRGSHQSPERYPFRHRFAMTPPPVGEAASLFEGRYVPVARCPAAGLRFRSGRSWTVPTGHQDPNRQVRRCHAIGVTEGVSLPPLEQTCQKKIPLGGGESPRDIV